MKVAAGARLPGQAINGGSDLSGEVLRVAACNTRSADHCCRLAIVRITGSNVRLWQVWRWSPKHNCLNTDKKFWRGERDSNRIQIHCQISKLRIRKTIRSPAIPQKPLSCHWSCHCKSLSRGLLRATSGRCWPASRRHRAAIRNGFVSSLSSDVVTSP